VTFAEAIDLVGRGDVFLLGFPYREIPPRHATFAADGVFITVSVEPGAHDQLAAMSWYEPDMLRRIAAPILAEEVPDGSLRPRAELWSGIDDRAVEIYKRALVIRSELEDGRRWIKGTRWTEPYLTRGGSGWLALELEKGKLVDMWRRNEDDLRAELCQVVMRDSQAHAVPVDSRIRDHALEIDAKAEAQLVALKDEGMGFEVKRERWLREILVQRGDEFAHLHVADGRLYMLDWTSAAVVRGEIAQRLVRGRRGGRGKLVKLDSALVEQLAWKTDRAMYPRLMREGKLRVGAIPAQTDSEWTLLYTKGEFRMRYAMDGSTSPISEPEADRILSTRGYGFVLFEDESGRTA
jgi:hypothetical protein